MKASDNDDDPDAANYRFLDESFPLLTPSKDRLIRTDSFHIETNLAAVSSNKASSTQASLFKRLQFGRDVLAISIIYFINGILDLALTATSYYLKDVLGLSASVTGLIVTLGQLPWDITPILGILTDIFPLFGYHRKAYLLLVGAVGGTSYLLLAHVHQSTFLACVLVFTTNVCAAWTEVIADSVTVKLSQGQEQDVAAFYQSLSWVTYTTGAVLSGFTTGVMLDNWGPRPVFIFSGFALYLIGICATIITEQPSRSKQILGQENGTSATDSSIFTALRKIWIALKPGHILIPVIFVLAWQASPSPSSAMFYFQTDVLHFSAEFLQVVYLCGTIAGFAGVLIYNTLLVNKSLKLLLFWCSLLAFLLNATQLLLISRLNLKLHLSDEVFVLGDYAMLTTFAEVMMTPMFAMAARLCPDGVEATLMSIMTSMVYLCAALSGAFGSVLTALFHVDSGSYGNMFYLVLTCNLCLLLPLPLLCFIPDAEGPTSNKEQASVQRSNVIGLEPVQEDIALYVPLEGSATETAAVHGCEPVPISRLHAPLLSLNDCI